jgi:hypothetical protein
VAMMTASQKTEQPQTNGEQQSATHSFPTFPV